MGWKTLKNAFSITHTVCVTDKGICIGSGYISNLATINISTGAMVMSEASPGFIQRTYPALASATPSDLLALISAEDQFDNAVTVYTYIDGKIVEKLCECAGYPNVTHDGELMYENAFSTDKNEVIGWCKSNAHAKVEFLKEHIARLQQQLADTEQELTSAQRKTRRLEKDYPSVSAMG
ncbi:hypothetical protein F2S72_08685 [Pseudomonas syringae pv. actinidiae]|nr:hypothetical protein [Pseudomonas syringae pv. actinidiae]